MNTASMMFKLLAKFGALEFGSSLDLVENVKFGFTQLHDTWINNNKHKDAKLTDAKA